MDDVARRLGAVEYELSKLRGESMEGLGRIHCEIIKAHGPEFVAWFLGGVLFGLVIASVLRN